MLKLLTLGLLLAAAFGGPRTRQGRLVGKTRSYAGRVIGGGNAEPGEFPSQLSLQVRGFHFCAASILSKRWALTAAHCLYGLNKSYIDVVAGSTDIKSGGSRHHAQKFVIHSGYDVLDLEHDIALIKVKEPFKMSSIVKPAVLPRESQTTEKGLAATVVGWGKISEGGPISKTLQKVSIQIQDQDKCLVTYSKLGFNVYPTEVCGHVTLGIAGACKGDSGGPLFVGKTLTGVVSWGYGCARPGFPTVYSRVSSYLDWIHKNTGL